MGLGINTNGGSGEFSKVVKYDARAGRFFRVDRTEVDGRYANQDVDITKGFAAIFDLEQIETGWMMFAAGVAPSFQMKPLGQDIGQRPTDQHKEGFRLNIKLGQSAGGDVRELASTAKVVIGAVDALHDAYLAGVKANPGKLPVVTCSDTKPIVTKSPKGTTTNYAPEFTIVKWVDRPADLPLADDDDAPTAAATPPSTGSTRAAPPPTTKPAPQEVSADDFG